MISPHMLLAGRWRWQIYEPALAEGFRALGWTVEPFKIEPLYTSHSTLRNLQKTLSLGPDIRHINKRLLKAAHASAPDVVFLNRPQEIWATTVERLKDVPNSVVVAYNNDNPFAGSIFRSLKWRHYLSSLKRYDITFVYRPSDIPEAQKRGADAVHLIKPYFTEGLHHPVSDCPDSSPPVVFIGHYEPDGRLEHLIGLWNQNIPLAIYGPRWDEIQHQLPEELLPIEPVFGATYNKTLACAKIALAFLSKNNADVYTRRCFEIPATGTLMIAERTTALQRLFREDREAVYFDGTAELVEKVIYYLEHPAERRKIARRGYERCIREKWNQYGRTEEMDTVIKTFLSERDK